MGTRARKTSTGLWIVQGLLMLLFLFAGVTKFTMPAEQVTGTTGLPLWFFQFIGVAEVAGALGLVLPGLTGIKPLLTTFAAAGLVIIMAGATGMTLITMSASLAVMPLVTGLLCGYVVYARTTPTA